MTCNEEAIQGIQEQPLFTKKEKKAAARDYNSRRANYRRQVSLLRKQYFSEIEQEKAEEQAKSEAERKEMTRRRLERQRLKNARSAKNAILMEQKRQARAREFEEHLRKKQIERDETNRRFAYARNCVIDELEIEASKWLTTLDEVENAFTHEAEQRLWAFPGGVIGEANPSVDSHFWQYESHTMHLDKTFRPARELLLEDLLKKVYDDATIDEGFWTSERVKDNEDLVQKAKLRAMVRAAGKRALLNKQKEMLQDYFETKEDEVPKRIPSPNVKILANTKAQEKEGVKALMNDPTKFFTFENSNEHESLDDSAHARENYSGPTLGAPVGIRDLLRDGTPGNGIFPLGVAVAPKEDTRTQREKKRQEREQKLWEAAQAAKEADIDGGLSDGDDTDDAIYYGDNSNWESDDEEWRKGLDPVEDADIIGVPVEKRYSEADIRWIVNELESRTDYLHSQLEREVDSSMQRLRTQTEDTNEAQDYNSLVNLTNDQVLVLAELVASQDIELMTHEDVVEALRKVPGMEEGQVKSIAELVGISSSTK